MLEQIWRVTVQERASRCGNGARVPQPGGARHGDSRSMDPAALPPQTLDPELPSLFAAAAPLDSSLPPMQIGGLGSTQELFTPSSASRRVAAESEQVVGSPQELCAPSPPSLGAVAEPALASEGSDRATREEGWPPTLAAEAGEPTGAHLETLPLPSDPGRLGSALASHRPNKGEQHHHGRYGELKEFLHSAAGDGTMDCPEPEDTPVTATGECEWGVEAKEDTSGEGAISSLPTCFETPRTAGIGTGGTLLSLATGRSPPRPSSGKLVLPPMGSSRGMHLLPGEATSALAASRGVVHLLPGEAATATSALGGPASRDFSPLSRGLRTGSWGGHQAVGAAPGSPASRDLSPLRGLRAGSRGGHQAVEAAPGSPASRDLSPLRGLRGSSGILSPPRLRPSAPSLPLPLHPLPPLPNLESEGNGSPRGFAPLNPLQPRAGSASPCSFSPSRPTSATWQRPLPQVGGGESPRSFELPRPTSATWQRPQLQASDGSPSSYTPRPTSATWQRPSSADAARTAAQLLGHQLDQQAQRSAVGGWQLGHQTEEQQRWLPPHLGPSSSMQGPGSPAGTLPALSSLRRSLSERVPELGPSSSAGVPLPPASASFVGYAAFATHGQRLLPLEEEAMQSWGRSTGGLSQRLSRRSDPGSSFSSVDAEQRTSLVEGIASMAETSSSLARASGGGDQGGVSPGGEAAVTEEAGLGEARVGHRADRACEGTVCSEGDLSESADCAGSAVEPDACVGHVETGPILRSGYDDAAHAITTPALAGAEVDCPADRATPGPTAAPRAGKGGDNAGGGDTAAMEGLMRQIALMKRQRGRAGAK